jgi:hypothetical protein
MIFQEGNLVFDFNDEFWNKEVVQFDEETDYKKVCNTLPSTKGVDFLGVLKNKSVVFIEVKDFRGHRIENKHRTEKGNDPLELEVAQKVKDSLCVLLSAARNSTHNKDFWQKCVQLIPHENATVRVILWLEEDLPPSSSTVNEKRRKAKGGTRNQRLKQKLRWIKTRVFVYSKRTFQGDFGLSVSDRTNP